MVDQIISDLQNEDYEEDQYNKEFGNEEDDGLKGFLGSLGIGLSPRDDSDDGPDMDDRYDDDIEV